MNFVFAIAMLVLSAFIQMLITPKQQGPKPASFDDVDIPQVEEGTAQPVIFGDVWSGDWVVLYYGGFATEAIKSSSGGKK